MACFMACHAQTQPLPLLRRAILQPNPTLIALSGTLSFHTVSLYAVRKRIVRGELERSRIPTRIQLSESERFWTTYQLFECTYGLQYRTPGSTSRSMSLSRMQATVLLRATSPTLCQSARTPPLSDMSLMCQVRQQLRPRSSDNIHREATAAWP